MSDDEISGNALRASVSDEYGADVYFYSGPIDDFGHGKIAEVIAKNKTRENAILILVTHGGLANPAYQIARLFQKTYHHFTVYTPSVCKSAGTLVALGAHGLIMDAFSELGPLDVQLLKQNEIVARKSGLLSRSSFEALAEMAFETYEQFMLRITMQSNGLVNFRLASELSASMVSNLLAPVYRQLDPEVLGSDFRDLSIAIQYGDRLVAHSDNASLAVVRHLVHGYPSHDFIIDSEEAGSLFNNVEPPSELLYRLLSCVGDPAYNEQPRALVFCLTTPDENEEDIQNAGDEEPRDAADVRPLDGGGGDDRPGDPGESSHRALDRGAPRRKSRRRASHDSAQRENDSDAAE